MGKRLAFIDALRGFAALYVLLFHIIYVPIPNLSYPRLLYPIFWLGYSGVTLFFIISAFTLCLTLDGRTEEKNWILKFYFRRAKRILPLYYFWLLIMAFVDYGPKLIYHKTDLLNLALFTYNFIPGHQDGIVWASWTLGVEMVFYLIFPIIFKMVSSLKGAIVFQIVTFLLAFIHYYYTSNIPGYKIHLGFLHQLPVFSIGIITYHIYKSYLQELNNKNTISKVFLCAFVALYMVAALLRTVGGNFVLYFLAFAYAFLLLGLSIRPYKTIVNRTTIFFGIISYSLYLNHPRIIYFLISYFREIYNFQLPDFLKLPICIGLVIIPLTIISYLTFNLIEKPGAKLVKKISVVIGV